MSDIVSSLRDEVILRAGNRCEYCRLSQIGQEATFHIDRLGGLQFSWGILPQHAVKQYEACRATIAKEETPP